MEGDQKPVHPTPLWMRRNWACVMLVGVVWFNTSVYCWRMTCDDEFIILNLWSICNIYKILFSLENKIVAHNEFRLAELNRQFYSCLRWCVTFSYNDWCLWITFSYSAKVEKSCLGWLDHFLTCVSVEIIQWPENLYVIDLGLIDSFP